MYTIELMALGDTILIALELVPFVALLLSLVLLSNAPLMLTPGADGLFDKPTIAMEFDWYILLKLESVVDEMSDSGDASVYVMTAEFIRVSTPLVMVILVAEPDHAIVLFELVHPVMVPVFTVELLFALLNTIVIPVIVFP